MHATHTAKTWLVSQLCWSMQVLMCVRIHVCMYVCDTYCKDMACEPTLLVNSSIYVHIHVCMYATHTAKTWLVSQLCWSIRYFIRFQSCGPTQSRIHTHKQKKHSHVCIHKWRMNATSKPTLLEEAYKQDQMSTLFSAQPQTRARTHTHTHSYMCFHKRRMNHTSKITLLEGYRHDQTLSLVSFSRTRMAASLGLPARANASMQSLASRT
jgi:hypothetical protein